MNSTNRFLNRICLFLVGVLLIALGASVAAVVLVPDLGRAWADVAGAARAWTDQAVGATLIGDSTLSWVAIAALAVIVIIVILLLVVALTGLGGGRTSTVLRTSSQAGTGEAGYIIVDSAFASDALRTALDRRPDVLFSSVTAHRIRKTAVMEVSVTPRQNTSPLDVAHDVDKLLRNLATLTGSTIPTYVSIHSGLRSRLAHDKELA
ncbi:hypothetical protein J7E25_16005 [Agromyces sp. ISL-38]|uniref:hypothetical protein n=1 Tax=Agromyces sp. ISL-38 TaxID=2819107 RepID=UPI001BE9A07F|nr:hypothetical protein [Agromyces sp. ISL-38]MBT2500601.1 hypothetical protein [Agromyces sp. ISL-38]